MFRKSILLAVVAVIGLSVGVVEAKSEAQEKFTAATPDVLTAQVDKAVGELQEVYVCTTQGVIDGQEYMQLRGFLVDQYTTAKQHPTTLTAWNDGIGINSKRTTMLTRIDIARQRHAERGPEHCNDTKNTYLETLSSIVTTHNKLNTTT